MTMAEIAELLGLPAGTVASRLRRGRELFRTQVDRLKSHTKGPAAGIRPQPHPRKGKGG
jgi:hypothetical protein